MAATAKHPDGNFVNAVEPDEDIAAIAKQISDHAEVIYQTWKAKGLAPNEILTCHSNLNVANKFGSVLTPKFETADSGNIDSNSAMTDVLYGNNATPANAGRLEHIIQEFVAEDKARLANRQKNADTPCALSNAKSYPSSIQYALQKFERISPNPVGVFSSSKRNGDTCSKPKTRFTSPVGFKPSEPCPPVRNSLKSTKVKNLNSDSQVDGVSTWPIKNKLWNNELKTPSEIAAAESEISYPFKSSTLPLKKEKNGIFCQNFMDEVAKEEEKLIHALKTGVVIAAANDSDPSDRSNSYSATLPVFKSSDEETNSVGLENNNHSIISTALQNLSKKSDVSNFNPAIDSTKRKKRFKPEETSNEISIAENAAVNASHLNLPNQSTKKPSTNPVRPFLTRGSVAERVMMFEKCPTEILEKRAKTNNGSAGSWKHIASDVHSKIQNYCKEADQRKPVHPPHTTLQRHTKASKNIFIPRFYYPLGKPITQQQQNIMLKNIEDVFRATPDLQITREQFASVTRACGCPLYWKAPLFAACGGEKLEHIDMNTFLDYWRNLTATCHDDASKFMKIITRSDTRQDIVQEDLIPMVQDVVNTHPGLIFLKQAPEFHSRYVLTVICRVYYSVNQSWNGRITLTELRKSDFLRAVQLLEEEEDINRITAYFSYEHFYVIYCKFWELDRDHDLFISKDDLARHSDNALSNRIIDRIFARCRTKSRNSHEEKMSYTDFVIFLLAEEDKRHPRAIEYWFRCMDLDGDGYLSMYELEHFYDEQLHRMETMGIECLPFEDCLCQMMDMIQPKFPGKISLCDLKRCKMTPVFFDTFFNLEKYLDHEQRDPFASHRDLENDMSDWDRYAAEEYELLVAEESGNDHCDETEQYDITDSEDHMDDVFSSNLDDILSGSRGFVSDDIDTIPGSAPAVASERVSEDVSSSPTFNYKMNEQRSEPNISFMNYRTFLRSNGNHSDSSDDYAGDSDDCSL